MKLLTSKNTYSASNNTLRISDDMGKVEAISYGWWRYAATDSVGNVIFNFTTYSPSTTGHQRDVRSEIRSLEISVSLELFHTRQGVGGHIYDDDDIRRVIGSEIDGVKREISELIGKIKTKGSWRRKNNQRRHFIRLLLYKVADLRNYKNNYIGKKKIPSRREKPSRRNLLLVEACFGQYFTNHKGKLDRNAIRDFAAENYGIGVRLSPSEDHNYLAIREFFGLKNSFNYARILGYRHLQDVNSMMPAEGTVERLQLEKWCKRMNINKKTLNNFLLDKLHTYQINKINRKEYSPAEPKTFPIPERLKKLAPKVKGLRLIENDVQLRREGRKQGHCIGSNHYIKQCLLDGDIPLNYKGYTFLLSSDLSLIECSGKHNAPVPSDIIKELGEVCRSPRLTLDHEDEGYMVTA